MPVLQHSESNSNGKAPSPFAGRRVRNYRRPYGRWYFHPALRDGRFTRWDVPAMLTDNAVSIGLYTMYGPLFGAKHEVRANSKEIKTYVENTLFRFWNHDLGKVLQHYIPYGTAICETMFEQDNETGLWRYAGMDDFDISDVTALRRGRHLSGARVTYGSTAIPGVGYATPDRQVQGEDPNAIPNELRHPKIFWCSHMPTCGELYGKAALQPAWNPWMEKVGAHGAISIRKLWAFSNAYRGCLVKFPVGSTMYNGRMVDNQDIARELAETYVTGGAMVCPSAVDETGNELWSIQDPKLNGEIKGLMEYPADLDRQIWQGMGVLDEVIHAPDTGGSWSGRSGPLLIFLNICDMRVREITTAFDVGPSGYTTRNEQSGGVIRPLVMENFGPKAKYEIRPISLVPKPAEPGAGGTPGSAPAAATGGGMPQEKPTSPNPVGPPPGDQADVPTQPMGANSLKLSAADPEVVELPDDEVAAILAGETIRLSQADASGHMHKDKGPGGGQFTGPGGGAAGSGNPAAEPAKPKHGERASKLHAAHAALKQQRIDLFNEVKGEAEEADNQAHDHFAEAKRVFDHNLGSGDEQNALDELLCAHDDLEWTPKERFESLKEIELQATKCLGKGEDAKKDEPHLKAIIASARAAREQLRLYVKHRLEMKAIKEGSSMDVQLSMALSDDDDFALSGGLFDDDAHPRGDAGRFTFKPIKAEHVKSAQKAFAAGKLKMERSEEPITSDASGASIHHHVTLPGGARVHPDELHRLKVEDGETVLHHDEGLTIDEPGGKSTASSFSKALHRVSAYSHKPDDPVTISSRHGYSATRPRSEWINHHDGHDAEQSFSEWYDAEGHQHTGRHVEHDGGATLASDEDTAAFFAGHDNEQGRLSFSAAWDESKHHRGQPGNPGQFGPGGGQAKQEPASPSPQPQPAAPQPAAAPQAPAKPKDLDASEEARKMGLLVPVSAHPILHEQVTPPPPGGYNPDPTMDSTGNGVADAAIVGVPAMLVPPPPPIPKLNNLTEHERAVEQGFKQAYEANPTKMAGDFLSLTMHMTKPGDPPTFGTDDAKVLTDAWSVEDKVARSQNRATLNTPLHQTANAIAKRAFLMHMDTLKPGDELLVTCGGCGSGKGYALKMIPKAKEIKARCKGVWDSAGDQSATENPWIQAEAEKRGLKVNYLYVHADPKVQWADPERGVIKRAADPADGRMVGARVFADSYANGARNMQAFAQRQQNNPHASFTFLQNAGPKPIELPGIPQEALTIDANELTQFAAEAVHKSNAPAHVKRGALMDLRIFGGQREQSANQQ